jgi:DNA repair exonuclease SbcCD ATPase subunit
MAVHVWLNYNRTMLDFRSRHPDQCLLMESLAVAQDGSRLVATIAEKFGHHLGPVADLYDEESYSRQASRQGMSVLARCFPEALELYEELRRQADVVAPAPFSAGSTNNSSTLDDWALQHWVDWRVTEQRLKQCRTELEQTSDALKDAQAGAEQARTACQLAEAERDEARTACQLAEAELQRVRAETEELRQRVRAETEALHRDLTEARRQVEEARALRQNADAEWHRQVEEARALRQSADAECHTALVLAKRLEEEMQMARQQIEVERHAANARVEQLRHSLEEVRQQADEARATITWMESSKAWKLRRWWHRLRHPFSSRLDSSQSG